jgi:hypothetical protein
MGRINQPSAAFIDRGSLRTGPVAESAGVEAVLVIIDLLGLAAGEGKVLDPREGEAFGTEIREVSLVEKAKGASEPEVPAYARPVATIAIPAGLFRRSMPPVNCSVGWQRA